MPELPEVETVRRALDPVMAGAAIVSVALGKKGLRKPFPAGLARALRGQRVRAVGRRAKYLLVELESGAVMLWHLGMSGHVRIYMPGEKHPRPGPHDHMRLKLDTGASIVFTDPRRFGRVDLFTPAPGAADVNAHPLLTAIGPEPLSRRFTPEALAARLVGRTLAIKPALMDAHIVAGIGNIYASEALFRAGISPTRAAGTISPARLKRLVAAIKQVLRAAIRAGGSTLKDHRTPDGELGYFQHHFAVYGRAGEACPGCDCQPARSGGIRKLVQGGRATFYCPRRQR